MLLENMLEKASEGVSEKLHQSMLEILCAKGKRWTKRIDCATSYLSQATDLNEADLQYISNVRMYISAEADSKKHKKRSEKYQQELDDKYRILDTTIRSKISSSTQVNRDAFARIYRDYMNIKRDCDELREENSKVQELKRDLVAKEEEIATVRAELSDYQAQFNQKKTAFLIGASLCAGAAVGQVSQYFTPSELTYSALSVAAAVAIGAGIKKVVNIFRSKPKPIPAVPEIIDMSKLDRFAVHYNACLDNLRSGAYSRPRIF